MKRKILSFIMALAVILSLVVIPGAKAEAAGSYPTIMPRKAQYTGENNVKSTICVYDTQSVYAWEKVVIDVYDATGKRVTGTSRTLYNTKKELAAGGRDSFTYSATPYGYAKGTVLTVVAKMQYKPEGSSDYIDSPQGTQTTTFVIGGSTGTHANEWFNGHWYNADGTQTYSAVLFWEGSGNSWYVIDSKGWYPTSQWLKIDGNWYYFTASGYMDYSEYRDGCWLNADGTCSTTYTHGTWHQDANGWWYEDNGWYPTNQYLWIDGTQYWFNGSGYVS